MANRDRMGRFHSETSRVHADGWVSALTGIGSPNRDKRLSHQFRSACLTYQQCIDLWSKDDMGRRIITFPASEAFREGYELTIADEGDYDDLKDQIDQRLLDLGVDEILEKALCMERALGGCAILVGYADGRDIARPADLTEAKGIDWLTLLEPIEIYPIQFYQDPKSPKYGEPELYALTGQSPGAVGMMEGRLPPPTGTIHESRLIIFEGIKVSRYQHVGTITGRQWGESILTALVEILRDFHVAWHAAGILATDFSAPTLTIPGLMNLLSKDPQKVAERLAAIQMSLSNARVIALDKDEVYDRKTTNIAGLADLLTQLSLRLSAGTGVPLRLLMGQIPTTIGESDTDIRIFYDYVRGMQKRRIRPTLRKIITLLMRSMRKYKIPKRWNVKFHPLWVLTDQEAAEARLAQARVDSMYLKAGVLTADEVRNARFVGEYSFNTWVDESKPAPGPIPPGMMAGPDGKPTHPPPPPVVPGAPGAPAGTAGHAVRPYARRNPTPTGATTAAKEGGDVPTGGSAEKRDSLVARMDSYQPLYYVEYAGFRIGIESPAGSVRKWVDQNGVAGETKMVADYGFISGVPALDGDCLDAYLGPNPNSKWVTIVRTMSPSSGFTAADEDKVFLGWPSVGAALAAFSTQYSDPRFMGAVSAMSIDDFRASLQRGEGAEGVTVETPTSSPNEEIAATCPECGDLVVGQHSCGAADPG